MNYTSFSYFLLLAIAITSQFVFQVNLQLLKEHINMPIIPISAKMGSNISTLLKEIRILYDNFKTDNPEENN